MNKELIKIDIHKTESQLKQGTKKLFSERKKLWDQTLQIQLLYGGKQTNYLR